MMENGLVSSRTEGTPQGSPLSPMLSNILLDELDKELESRGHRFCRYADDFNVYVKSNAAGQRVMESLTKFLNKRLRLKVNQDKSAVDRPWNRQFLGYSFTAEEKPRIRVSPKSMKSFRQKLKPIWKRGKGQSMKTTIKQLNQIIVGWASYYRLSQWLGIFKELDSWIRHRIRCIIWRHWKTPRTRFINLRKRGVPIHLVKILAYSNNGPWKASQLPGMNRAFPNSVLECWGLKSLFHESQRFAISK
jgi:RNA-directed DNA polymerase